MKKILILTTLICSLTLAGCAAKETASPPTPPSQKPATITITPIPTVKVDLSGDPQADAQAINNDIKDLDATTDFKTFNQSDLTQ